jgi:hypothetical protein
MSASPDASMLWPARCIVRFMESGDSSLLDEVFAEHCEIVDSFAPFLFDGPDAPGDWARRFGLHISSHEHLQAEIRPAEEFGEDGDRVYFSLPVLWRYTLRGIAYRELGALAVVLHRTYGTWRVIRSSWAVASTERAM